MRLQSLLRVGTLFAVAAFLPQIPGDANKKKDVTAINSTLGLPHQKSSGIKEFDEVLWEELRENGGMLVRSPEDREFIRTFKSLSPGEQKEYLDKLKTNIDELKRQLDAGKNKNIKLQ